jgi:hypothetical protein
MNISVASTERSFDTSDYDSDEYEKEERKDLNIQINVKDSKYLSTSLLFKGISSVAEIFLSYYNLDDILKLKTEYSS